MPGAAKVAAIGTSTWAATENTPAIKVPAASKPKLLAVPLRPDSNMPQAASSIRPTTRRRRSSMSPSGTSKSSPKPYDTWAMVTVLAALASLICKCCAIECSSGWLK